MKKLLVSFVLLSTLFTSNNFCSKKQNINTQQSAEEARIQRKIDDLAQRVLPKYIATFREQYLSFILGKKKELEKDLERYNLTEEKFTDLIFETAFALNIKQVIATCLYNLNKSAKNKNKLEKSNLLNEIRQTIATILIPHLSQRFEKKLCVCEKIFFSEVVTSTEIYLQQQKTMSRDVAIDILLRTFATTVARLILTMPENYFPKDNIDNTEEEGEDEEEGEQSSSESEEENQHKVTLEEKHTPGNVFIEECERARKKIDQEFSRKIEIGLHELGKKHDQNLAQLKIEREQAFKKLFQH